MTRLGLAIVLLCGSHPELAGCVASVREDSHTPLKPQHVIQVVANTTADDATKGSESKLESPLTTADRNGNDAYLAAMHSVKGEQLSKLNAFLPASKPVGVGRKILSMALATPKATAENHTKQAPLEKLGKGIEINKEGLPAYVLASRIVLFGAVLLSLVALVVFIVMSQYESHNAGENLDLQATSPTSHEKRSKRRCSTDLGCVDYLLWQDLVDKDELDFYTCVSLSWGRYNGVDHRTFHLLPKVAILFFMQVVLVMLLIAYNVQRVQFYAHEENCYFRAIGSVLMAYSIWRLCMSGEDGCRTMALKLMLTNSASGWYIWPALLGEFINVFVAMVLTGTLFEIYCGCSKPSELLINCVAINFVSDIDNHLVSSDEKSEASDNFKYAVGEMQSLELHWVRQALRKMFVFMIQAMQWCTPLAGVVCTFMFGLAHEPNLCREMRGVQPWPFCLGISSQGEL